MGGSLAKRKHSFSISLYIMRKPPIGIERIYRLQPIRHPKIPQCKWVIQAGFPPHFHHLRLHHSMYAPGTMFYCVDKPTLHIAFDYICDPEISVRTYVSKKHFETVEIQSRPRSIYEIGKPQSKSQKCQIKQFLSTKKIIMIKSFLDCHPLEAYLKLRGYLNCSFDRQKMHKWFEKPHIGRVALTKDLILLPMLQSQRLIYLQQNRIKLRKINRLTTPSPQTAHKVLMELKQICEIDSLKLIPCDDGVLNWAIQNDFGTVVSLEELLEGRFQNFFYSHWN